MIRSFVIGLGTLSLISLSSALLAQDVKHGTEAEARAMLQKTIAAVKADKAKALEMIAKGEGGFLDRDLYPFCFNNTDGKIYPFPNPNATAVFGADQRKVKDASGKNFGQMNFDAAQKPDGIISAVEYVWPKPGDSKPSVKVSFVTRIGDLGCGVGYYK
jgi:signal transduction histidine kinase